MDASEQQQRSTLEAEEQKQKEEDALVQLVQEFLVDDGDAESYACRLRWLRRQLDLVYYRIMIEEMKDKMVQLQQEDTCEETPQPKTKPHAVDHVMIA